MQTRKHARTLSLLLLLAFTPASFAMMVDVSYTSDNLVVDWWILESDGDTVFLDLVPGPNAGDWPTADSDTVSLPNGDYFVAFHVRNLGVPDAGNPAGFLAEISGTGVSGDLLTGSGWEYAIPSFSPTWSTVSTHGDNSGDPNVWSDITGISGAAEWIWGGSNFDTDTPPDLWVRGSITVVPIPPALWLLASSLLALGLVARHRGGGLA